MNVLVIIIAGFLGAISRYALGEWIHTNNGFPLGTLLINLIGCFLLSWILTLASKKKNISPKITLFIGTGFLGSFTTFSTFSVETIQLFHQGDIVLAFLYVSASVLFGLLLAYAGYRLAAAKRNEDLV